MRARGGACTPLGLSNFAGVCTESATCGNNMVEAPGEDCDDGNTNANDAARRCARPSLVVGTIAHAGEIWRRNDIVFCEQPTATEPPARDSAQSLCSNRTDPTGASWSLCIPAEFMDRNDAFSAHETLTFAATLEDGDDCFVVNAPGSPHNAALDEAREGVSGSCSGPTSSNGWGRQADPGSAFARAGAMCCYGIRSPDTGE